MRQNGVRNAVTLKRRNLLYTEHVSTHMAWWLVLIFNFFSIPIPRKERYTVTLKRKPWSETGSIVTLL